MALQDMVWIIVFLVFFAILTLVATYLSDNMFPALKEKLGAGGDIMVDKVDQAFNVLDPVFLVVAIGMLIAIGILAWRITASPAVIFLAIIVSAILIGVIAPTMQKVMWRMFDTSQFSSYETDYPIMSKIFENYGLYVLVGVVILLIVLYASYKSKSGIEGE